MYRTWLFKMPSMFLVMTEMQKRVVTVDFGGIKQACFP